MRHFQQLSAGGDQCEIKWISEIKRSFLRYQKFKKKTRQKSTLHMLYHSSTSNANHDKIAVSNPLSLTYHHQTDTNSLRLKSNSNPPIKGHLSLNPLANLTPRIIKSSTASEFPCTWDLAQAKLGEVWLTKIPAGQVSGEYGAGHHVSNL